MAWYLVKHRDNFSCTLLCSKQPKNRPQPEPVCSANSHHIFVSSFLILPSHLCLGLPSVLLPFRFCNQNIVYIFHLLHVCYMLLHPFRLWFCHTSTLWRRLEVPSELKHFSKWKFILQEDFSFLFHCYPFLTFSALIFPSSIIINTLFQLKWNTSF